MKPPWRFRERDYVILLVGFVLGCLAIALFLPIGNPSGGLVAGAPKPSGVVVPTLAWTIPPNTNVVWSATARFTPRIRSDGNGETVDPLKPFRPSVDLIDLRHPPEIKFQSPRE